MDEFQLVITQHPNARYNYALCKRKKFLWWRYWECFAATWHVELSEYYMEEAGMTKENTTVIRRNHKLL